MSDVPFVRSYSPHEREIDGSFIRRYVTGSTCDERVPDADATFGLFIATVIQRIFPRVTYCDATIRIGTPHHESLVRVWLRAAIEFLALYQFCVLAMSFSSQLTLEVFCWAASNQLLIAVMGYFAIKDTTLFFATVANTWRGVSWFPFGLFYACRGFEILLPVAVIAWCVDLLIHFAGGKGPFESLKRAGRVVVCATLAYFLTALFDPRESKISFGLPFFVADFVLLFPIARNLQYWFAANRYTSLDDVRNYGASAIGNVPLIMRLRKLHLLIAVVPMIACEVMIVQKLLIILPIAGTNPVFVARHLAIMFGFLTLMSLIHWLGLEITYHRRIPNPVRFIHSYYSTWRALAAWLSPTPDIDHPGVFRFQQPWTNDEVRRQLVAIALAINAAIVVSAIANWGEQVFRPSEQMAVAASAEAEYVAPSRFERLLFVATFPEFLLTALVASVIVPPLLFFVSLHCIWGPTFETFNERFECFRFTAKAPVLIGAGDSKHL